MDRPLVIDIAWPLAVFFSWLLANDLAVQVGRELGPLVAAGMLLLFVLIFALRFLARGADPAQIVRRARSGVSPLGAHWPWAALTALAVSTGVLALLSVYSRFVPSPPDPDWLRDYFAQPGAWPHYAVVAVIGSPLVEEVVFRGWIQGRITRSYGPELGIVNGAALFAIFHLDPWAVPHLFLLGLASGYSVHLTGSIWSAVLLMSVFGVGAMAADRFADQFTALSADTAGIARVGAVAALAGAIALFSWHRQRLLRDRIAQASAPSTEAGPSH